MFIPLNKQEIFELQRLADQNIDRILDLFNIKLEKNSKYFIGPCPIHGGDNQCGILIWWNQEILRWRCQTHQCHTTCLDTSLGLIRGLLSSRAGCQISPGKLISFGKVIQFCKDNLSYDNISPIAAPTPSFPLKIQHTLQITREVVRSHIKTPSDFFIQKGYHPDILDQYDVGPSIKPHKKTYWREIVPVYNHEGTLCIGCTARTRFSKCEACGAYHDLSWKCPKPEISHMYCKWKNVDFRKAFSLYNSWKLQRPIKNLVIVESPGNVWKFVEAGYPNVVALYGNKMSQGQEDLLKFICPDQLYIGMDNDEAGQLGFKLIGEKLWETYNIHKLEIPSIYNDFGEMKIKDLKDKILKQITN